KYARRKKCNTLYGHTALTQFIGRVGNLLLSSCCCSQRLDRLHPLQVIQQCCREASRARHLLAAYRLSSLTDQRHIKRNDWCRQQQDEAGHPIGRENREEEKQWAENCSHPSWQIA